MLDLQDNNDMFRKVCFLKTIFTFIAKCSSFAVKDTRMALKIFKVS